VWCQDALNIELDEPVDVVVSTAALHWTSDHARLWARLARSLRPDGVLEVQCGGQGNIDRIRKVIDVSRLRLPSSSGSASHSTTCGSTSRP
jgi:trans-aconitate methyltransferase